MWLEVTKLGSNPGLPDLTACALDPCTALSAPAPTGRALSLHTHRRACPELTLTVL